VAKKCKLAKNERQKRLQKKFKAKREELLAVIRNPETTLDERMAAYRKLARVPLDANPVRYRNRCDVSGRPRGFYRKFRLSRIALRQLALEGKLPGVTKASW